MRDEIQGLIWYFGYGSNMNRGIFEDRRGMRPLHAQSALLENYRLCFNLAIGRGNGGEQIGGFTYQSDRISIGRKPSARYIGWLIEGAAQHGLPPHYLDYLRTFDLAADERRSQAQ